MINPWQPWIQIRGKIEILFAFKGLKLYCMRTLNKSQKRRLRFYALKIFIVKIRFFAFSSTRGFCDGYHLDTTVVNITMKKRRIFFWSQTFIENVTIFKLKAILLPFSEQNISNITESSSINSSKLAWNPNLNIDMAVWFNCVIWFRNFQKIRLSLKAQWW